ncbi:MAG: rod shape-determining protein MreC [Acidimicrobiales bacterium]
MATSRSRRRLWTVGAALALVVTVLYSTGGVVSGLRGAANLVVKPFSWSVNEVARPLGHLFAGAVNYSDVVAQNAKLRYELGQAQQRADEQWALERQLQEMTTALNVPFVGALPTVAAQVTTLSPTSFAATIDISKGRDDGVLEGMPVVANGGLVGVVISTTPRGATVRLISDVNSLVGVTFAHGATSLVVSGRGVNNGLSATSVPLATALRPGTLLSTDGLAGGLFPPGLPVARVTAISLTPGAATYDVALRPTADLRHLLYVDVVLWEPST